MTEKWYLTGPCPECGNKTKWIPNYVKTVGNQTFEVGQYICSFCGANSGIIETQIDWTSIKGE